jgi:ATP-dependent RNA helicase SUPV3L1/SUV3
MIRPLLAWRANRDPEAKPPKGSTGDGGFIATPEMMSILGCSPDELGKVLKALGFRLDRRPVKTAPAAADAEPAAAAHSAEQTPETPAEALSADATVQEPVAAAEAATETAPAADPAAASETAAPADAAPEIQYEDVWRPRRHIRDTHERGEGRPEHRRHERHHRGNRHNGNNQPISAASTSDGSTLGAAPVAPAEVTTSDRPNRIDRDRNRRPEGRNDRDLKRASGDRPQQGQRKDPRRDDQRRDNRGDRGDRRREERNQPRAITAAPPRAKAGAEADSPFAALMALRSQLEQTRRDKG